MLPDSEPDTLEKVVRFVCGLILGAILGPMALKDMGIASHREAALLIAGCALAFAFCAMKFGDRFWRGILGVFGRW